MASLSAAAPARTAPAPIAPAPTGSPITAALAEPQTARVRVRFGRRGVFRAQLSVTPAGLLAIGGLVAAVLLSVTPVVHAAGKARARRG